MFVLGTVPDEDHPQDAEPLPAGVRGLYGLRTTQVGYLTPSNTKDHILDNLYWKGWNTALDLGRQWRGVTRFLTLDPIPDHPALATWMQSRAFIEELWRHGQSTSRAFRGLQEAASDPPTTTGYVILALEVLAAFEVFESNNPLIHPNPYPYWLRMTHRIFLWWTSRNHQRERSGLGFNGLSSIQLGRRHLKVPSRKYDALTHVMPNEKVLDEEILPSKFVLVNKADPKNQ